MEMLDSYVTCNKLLQLVPDMIFSFSYQEGNHPIDYLTYFYTSLGEIILEPSSLPPKF